jgi:ERCC4-type nuclease
MEAAIISAVLGGFVVTIGTLSVMHYQNRKDTSEMIQLLKYTLTEHRPHSHGEQNGDTLTARGIRYPRDFQLRK